ncbi:MAG: chromosome segregation protein SMC [Eubacteriales bacterium]|nr:chromosome segregation protein SMC [Eubacteriales bacterium]
MYLQAIEIQGFKSFPKHQYIEFHPGVTAIVGPNGCGKSNVTDAVRWVLGEQSAKSMRGDKMEDVIFNGTDARKRMAYAEVSIHLNNADRSLERDQDLVVITRRYFRSGESEYLINQQNCRLKDIHLLLADTGIGKDGYSVIEQGRVDDILSERSEDRRKIFDEAAGIVKFKLRKTEAEQKLARTADSWQRLGDILQEMERQLKPLARQAEVAERYKQIYGEARNLDIYLSIAEISKEEDQTFERQEYQRQLEQDLTEIEKEREEVYQERQASLEQRQSSEETNEKLADAFREADRRLASLKEEEVQAAERLRYASARQTEIKIAQTDLEANSGNLEEKLTRREQHRSDLLERKQQLATALSAKEAEFAEYKARLDEAAKLKEAKTKQLSDLRQQLFDLRSSSFAKHSEDTQLAEREAELKLSIDKEEAYLKAQTTILSSKREALTQAQIEKAKLAEVLQLKAKELEAKAQSLRDSEKFLTEFALEVKHKQYQADTLRRLEENQEGYHQAVRSLSQAVENDPSLGEGLLGPVAQLIRVDKKYELAVEMALGGAIHNLVTDTAVTASRLIHWLNDTRSGRETFLPLDKIEYRRLSPGDLRWLNGMPGFLGCLSDFIEVPSELDRLAAYLGGRLVLAEDLDCAMRMAQRSGQSLRIVTLAGEIINPGGSMTGGQRKKALSGLLSRSQDIQKLEEEIQNITAKAKQLQSELTNKQAESKQLRASLQEDQQLLQEAELKLAGLAAEAKQEETLLTEHKSRKESLDADLRVLEERQAGVRSDQANLERQIDTLTTQENKLLEADSRSTDDSGATELEDLRNQIVDFKIQMASLEEALKGIEELQKQLLAEQEQRSTRALDLETESLKLSEETNQIQKRSSALATEKERWENELDRISAEQVKLREQKQSAVAAESKLFEQLEQINERLTVLNREKERYQAQTERIADKLNQEKNRLWEEYRLSYNQAKDLAKTLDPADKSKKRLRILQEELRSMPQVNHAAPEDYAALKERYELLQTQRADVEETRNQLTQVIEGLEDAMRKQFTEELAVINKDFQECFAALFSGGRAELQAGEGDLLTCDIEIKAQPPGKRLQNLRLLSGGERALTAIALIFAIFRQRPAPFCFLDEVDSALDETNVIRFAEFIRGYTDTTQFIVVTHRKGTMEAADRLYGVTMKERGVSDILSLELAESEAYAQA